MLTPNWKIEITRDDNTVDSIMSDLLMGNVTGTASVAIGSFRLLINNKEGKYKGNWDGGERVDIWADYGASSNQIFRGNLEKPQYGFTGKYDMTLIGSDGGRELMEVHVTKTYTNADVADIVDDVITNYATNVTYDKVLTGYTIDKISFRGKRAWWCIREALDRAGHYFYIDTDLTLKHYVEGSQTNRGERVVHGINMKSCKIGIDIRDVKNRIKVYGGVAPGSSDVLYMKTVNDTVSQSDYGIKELPINESHLTDLDSVETKADYLLAKLKDPRKSGTFSSVGLPTLKPGQAIFISAPYANVGEYLPVQQYTHTYNARTGFRTRGIIKELRKLTEERLKDIYDKLEGVQTFTNPFEMKNSYVIDFNESPSLMETLSNVEEVESTLQLESGQTSGVGISKKQTLDSDATEFEMRLYGQDLEVSTIDVSANNGVGYTESSVANTKYTFTASGKEIVVKVSLIKDSDNPFPKVFSIGVNTK